MSETVAAVAAHRYWTARPVGGAPLVEVLEDDVLLVVDDALLEDDVLALVVDDVLPAEDVVLDEDELVIPPPVPVELLVESPLEVEAPAPSPPLPARTGSRPTAQAERSETAKSAIVALLSLPWVR
jgi:hypothetical protein